MWTRLRIDDIRSIVHYLGLMVALMGVLMFIPCVMALLAHEWNPAVWLLFSAGISICAGLLMSMVKPVEPGLNRKQAVILTGLAWLVGAVAGCTPLYLSGDYQSYFDAMFQAMADITNTGMFMGMYRRSTAVSIIMWHNVMTLVGAQGVVLAAMGLGTISILKGGTGSLMRAEGHDLIGSQLADTSKFVTVFISIFTGAGTVICTLLLVFGSGLTPGYALLHGFSLSTSAVATAGVTYVPAGFAYYRSLPLEVVLTVFQLSGYFSFALYYYMLRKGAREFFRDIETRVLLGWAALVVVVLSLAFAADNSFNELHVFLDKGLFNFFSALTGTGYMSISPSQLAGVATPAVVFTFILAIAVGGASSSTSAGFKGIHLALLLKTFLSEVRKTLMPAHAKHEVHFYHFGDQVLTPELSRNAMIIILLFVISFLAGSVLGVAYGYDPMAAILESVSLTTTCGFSTGVCSPAAPLLLKICYFVQMTAGRLEFLTLLTTVGTLLASAGYAIDNNRVRRACARHIPLGIQKAWKGTGGARRLPGAAAGSDADPDLADSRGGRP